MKKFVGIFACILAMSLTARANIILEIARMVNLPISSLGECVVASKLSGDQLTRLEHLLRHGGSGGTEADQFLGELDCFIACTLEKSKMLKNNKISKDRLMRTVERNYLQLNDKVRNSFAMCIDRANLEDDKCRIAHVFSVCLLRQFKAA